MATSAITTAQKSLLAVPYQTNRFLSVPNILIWHVFSFLNPVEFTGTVKLGRTKF